MIKFLKVRDVADPVREDGNVGFDFFIPKFNDAFRKTCAEEAEKNPKAAVNISKDDAGKECIMVGPHERVCIPSGIKSYLDLGMPLASYGLQMDLYVENKSGVATKKGLDVGACEIDPNYQGEIHLSLTNASDDYLYLYEGDKITQLAPRVYCTEQARIFVDEKIDSEADNKISEADFYEGFRYNNRGAGGFGSTGTKAK